jgi:hypothetical protein
MAMLTFVLSKPNGDDTVFYCHAPYNMKELRQNISGETGARNSEISIVLTSSLIKSTPTGQARGLFL